MTGQVFGKLTVLNRVPAPRQARWLCRCTCGNESIVPGYELRHGLVHSCGCAKKERASKLNLTHGMSKSKIYRTYKNMINRCYRTTNPDYPRYGGIGIKVCQRWLESFENFYADMGDVPEGHSIDRIDFTKNYELSNCKWSTLEQQQNNRKSCIFVEYLGKNQTLAQWCRELNLPYKTIRARITDYGWQPVKALTTQIR
jgi:hypothetical protein